jgi:hypothetical protein
MTGQGHRSASWQHRPSGRARPIGDHLNRVMPHAVQCGWQVLPSHASAPFSTCGPIPAQAHSERIQAPPGAFLASSGSRRRMPPVSRSAACLPDCPKKAYYPVGASANAQVRPMKPRLRVVGPSNQNRTVPGRRPNAELRTREYLTPAEIKTPLPVAVQPPSHPARPRPCTPARPLRCGRDDV